MAESCFYLTEETIGAKNFNFASKFIQNGRRGSIEFCISEDNFPARKQFSNRQNLD